MDADGKPVPPPEAILIRRARQARRIKAPAAARLAGISTARWSQIENGYERRDGRYKPVTASTGTLAHMAYAVGVTQERLIEAGRRDAAEILAEIARQRDEEPVSEADRNAAAIEAWEEYLRSLPPDERDREVGKILRRVYQPPPGPPPGDARQAG